MNRSTVASRYNLELLEDQYQRWRDDPNSVEVIIGQMVNLVKDGQPVRTDGGNLIYDAACGAIPDPALLAATLKSVTGVVDHGLFLDLADEALIGGSGGVEHLTP